MIIRTELAALMMCFMSTAGVIADDAAVDRPQGLVGWLTPVRASKTSNETGRESSAVRPAVVVDAEKEAPEIHRTSDDPRQRRPQTEDSPLKPAPNQLAPVLPNASLVSGPQYSGATGSTAILQPVHPGQNWQQYQAPVPVHQTAPGYFSLVSRGLPAGTLRSASERSTSPVSTSHSGGPGAAPDPGTALYPSPVRGIPQQTGGAAISNQFLHPHEMLYQHRYRALYPPYYYKVNGKWCVTPFGVWSHEDWYLQGTTVDVKYHSHKRPFSFFYPNQR